MHANRGSRLWAGSFAAAVLLLAACGGGDADTASDGPTTTSTAAGDASTTTTAGTGDAPAAGSAEARSSAGPAEASSGGGAAPTTAPVNNVADDTPGLPGAGQYRYHTTGTSKIGANPSQPVNEDTTTTVVHLGDGRVRQSGNGQETLLQFADATVLLHTMDFNSPGFERHFEAKPPVQ